MDGPERTNEGHATGLEPSDRPTNSFFPVMRYVSDRLRLRLAEEARGDGWTDGKIGGKRRKEGGGRTGGKEEGLQGGCPRSAGVGWVGV